MRLIKNTAMLAISTAISLIGLNIHAAFADETNIVSRQDRLDQQAEKIRLQFRDSETPDSIMFQSIIRRVSDRYAVDPERTTRNVRYDMKFNSDAEAVEFISICNPSTPMEQE